MKILHIVSNIKKSSGIMHVIMNFNNNINTSDFQFDYLYYDEFDEDYKKEINYLGGIYYKINRPTIFNVLITLWDVMFFLRKNIKEYDVIHIHDLIIGPVIGLIAKKYNMQNIIVHSHSTKLSNNLLKSFRNRFCILPLKFLNSTNLACSEKAGNFLFGKNNFIILHNAIDLSKFQFDLNIRDLVREENGISKNIVIGHVGRFSEEKNHEFMIRIINYLKDYHERVILLLVGEGPTKNKIENLVRKLNLEKHVLFLGQRDDVFRIYQAMDCFLLPSKFEGLGMVSIEAQTSGLKCLLSDTVPKDVIITEQTKFIDINDFSKWIKEIEDSINITYNRNLINLDRNYDIVFETKKLENIYSKYIIL